MGINKEIKSARESRKISQRELGRRIGKTGQYISVLESREDSNPSIELIKSIAKALDVDVREFIAQEDKSLFETMKNKKAIDKPLFDRIGSEITELHKNGLIADYIVTMSSEEFSVFVLNDSGSGAGIRGKFNGKYADRGGFFEFLEEMRGDLDE